MNFEFSPSLQRGLVLKEQGRFAEAEKFIRESLAQNPLDPVALYHLAGCQLQESKRAPEALRSIDSALAIAPEDPDYLVLRAFILCVLAKPVEAIATAQSALEQNPVSSAALTAWAQALLQQCKWAEAEEKARDALGWDADNASAANLLAHALRMQNKMDENADQIRGMLARDPDDAWTHSSAGWSALHRGERAQAETHFLEALRLDPEMENARQGLLQAYKARSPVFRAYLAYNFLMQRLSHGRQIMVFVGLYAVFQGAKFLFSGPYAWVGMLAGLAYFLFVFWVWIAEGVGNFVLLCDRTARHSLKKREKIEAVVVGGGVFAGILLLGCGLLTDLSPPLIAGGTLLMAAFPFALTFTNPSKVGRIVFGAMGGWVILVGALLFASEIAGLEIPDSLQTFLIGSAVLTPVLATWMGNIPSLRRER